MKGKILLAAVAFAVIGATSASAQGDTTKKAPAKAAAMTKAPAKAATKAPAPKFSEADIKAAQEGLAKEKFFTGTPNGKLDRATTAAIRKYQTAHKIAVTGQLSDSLIAALKAAQ
jgi:peptidoglycan hydrolase-like protein with peptidoglycan-binding domain